MAVYTLQNSHLALNDSHIPADAFSLLLSNLIYSTWVHKAIFTVFWLAKVLPHEVNTHQTNSVIRSQMTSDDISDLRATVMDLTISEELHYKGVR